MPYFHKNKCQVAVWRFDRVNAPPLLNSTSEKSKRFNVFAVSLSSPLLSSCKGIKPGGPERIRTADLLIANEAFYH